MVKYNNYRKLSQILMFHLRQVLEVHLRMELQTAIHRQCPRPLGQYPKMTNRFRVSYGYGVTIF